jgi:hypothetical protein
MQKNLYSFFRVALISTALATLFASCKKDIQVQVFIARTQTFYRVVPVEKAIPLTVNGEEKLGFSYFPGGGKGTATGLGECITYFNQLVYSTTGQLPPEGSVGAPVVDVPGYPVTGGPLPLIQPGEQEELASIVSELNIPAEVHNQILNQIFVNEDGDAVFLSAITGTSSTFPISQTVIGFKGRASIVGGRGKFANATGGVDYNGSFNVTDPNDAEYNADGWIVY